MYWQLYCIWVDVCIGSLLIWIWTVGGFVQLRTLHQRCWHSSLFSELQDQFCKQLLLSGLGNMTRIDLAPWTSKDLLKMVQWNIDPPDCEANDCDVEFCFDYENPVKKNFGLTQQFIKMSPVQWLQNCCLPKWHSWCYQHCSGVKCWHSRWIRQLPSEPFTSIVLFSEWYQQYWQLCWWLCWLPSQLQWELRCLGRKTKIMRIEIFTTSKQNIWKHRLFLQHTMKNYENWDFFQEANKTYVNIGYFSNK